jgi:exopolysaccharide biosynthesis protein
VRSGKKDINVRRDGFSASAATNKAWRCAAGATKDGKLVLCAVSQSITLSTLADVMLELGARDAINLDGGSMCALYVDGKYRVQPARSMSNILVVYKR